MKRMTRWTDGYDRLLSRCSPWGLAGLRALSGLLLLGGLLLFTPAGVLAQEPAPWADPTTMDAAESFLFDLRFWVRVCIVIAACALVVCWSMQWWAPEWYAQLVQMHFIRNGIMILVLFTPVFEFLMSQVQEARL